LAVSSPTGNIFADAAALAANSYNNTPSSSALGWQPLGAADLDIAPSGAFSAGTYSFNNGIYVGIDASNSTVAHLYVGDLNGETTLALAFRGTDEVPGDLPDHLHFTDHYAKFQPLISGITAYADDPSHDVDRVLVAGHSLGSAMVTTAMVEEGWANDPKYLGVAIASHGTDASVAQTAPAEVTNLVNFIHTQDFLVLAQEDGLPASTLAAAVTLPSFGSEADFEPKARVGVDVWIETGNAVRLLGSASQGSSEDPVTAEHRIGRYEADIKTLAEQQALEPETLLSSTQPHYFAVGTKEADNFAQDQFSVDEQINEDFFPTKDFDQQFYTGAGDDRIGGSGGDDLIDGGPGTDTAYYRGFLAEYTITTGNGTTRIEHSSSGPGPFDGADTLLNVESLHFADGARAIDDLPIAQTGASDRIAITLENLIEEPLLTLIAIRDEVSNQFDETLG
jgi:hypothetical protein